MAKTAKKVLTTTIEQVYSPEKKSSKKASKLPQKSKKRQKQCVSKVKLPRKRVSKNDEIRVRDSMNSSTSSAAGVTASPSFVNLWDKAMKKNHKLEDWIHEYNEQMEKVDEMELSIVSE